MHGGEVQSHGVCFSASASGGNVVYWGSSLEPQWGNFSFWGMAVKGCTLWQLLPSMCSDSRLPEGKQCSASTVWFAQFRHSEPLLSGSGNRTLLKSKFPGTTQGQPFLSIAARTALFILLQDVDV